MPRRRLDRCCRCLRRSLRRRRSACQMLCSRKHRPDHRGWQMPESRPAGRARVPSLSEEALARRLPRGAWPPASRRARVGESYQRPTWAFGGAALGYPSSEEVGDDAVRCTRAVDRQETATRWLARARSPEGKEARRRTGWRGEMAAMSARCRPECG